MVYSCSKPNQKSASSSKVPRTLDACGEPSGFNTSASISEASRRSGSGSIRPGFSRQSDEWPSACSVELPSKAHSGQSDGESGSLSTIFVLLRSDGSGV